MDRRTFLNTTAAVGTLGIASTTLARPKIIDDVPTLQPLTPNSTWGEIRKHFLLDPDVTHLAGLLLASHPKSVRDAIQKYRDAFDRNPVLAHDDLNNEKEVLKQAARYLQTSPDLIALTDSTTMGLALVYNGIKLDRNDHVITSVHDHYSTRESLRFSTERQGAKLETIELYRDGADATVDMIVSTISSHITSKTRLIALTWVHSGTGVKMPIRQIAERIKTLNQKRKKKIFLFVDGVHAFGIENLVIQDLGCDVFVAGCHKWLFGPRGTGIVWANEDAWRLIDPTIPTFYWPVFSGWLQGLQPEEHTKAAQMTPGGFHSFEHRWALDEAFKFHLSIGKERIEHRIHSLNTTLKQALTALPRLHLHTPLSVDLSAGIVTFEVEGKTPAMISEELRKNHIIGSTTPYSTSYARLTPGILNTEQDIERAVSILSDIV